VSEGGKLPLTARMCLTCKKVYRAWFATQPIVKGECAKCFIKRTTPRRKRKRK
jgi:hypothetical protein